MNHFFKEAFQNHIDLIVCLPVASPVWRCYLNFIVFQTLAVQNTQSSSVLLIETVRPSSTQCHCSQSLVMIPIIVITVAMIILMIILILPSLAQGLFTLAVVWRASKSGSQSVDPEMTSYHPSMGHLILLHQNIRGDTMNRPTIFR